MILHFFEGCFLCYNVDILLLWRFPVKSFIEDINLTTEPFLFRYRYRQTKDYHGYYHAHQGLEFLLIHQGSGQVTVNQQLHTVNGEVMWIFPPYELHRVEMEISEVAPYERSMLVVDPLALESYLQTFTSIRLMLNQLEDYGAGVRLLHTTRDSLEPITALFDYYGEMGPLQKEDLALLAVQLLHCVHNSLTRQGLGQAALMPRRNRHMTEQVMHWVEQHYGMETINLTTLAEELHISKYYLARRFKRETGTTIWDYVTARRLRQACLLLSSTDLSVSTIGNRIGLPDASYFSQFFRRITGVSPLQYRSQFVENHSITNSESKR
jgi:AraC-like DNA-binding protein